MAGYFYDYKTNSAQNKCYTNNTITHQFKWENPSSFYCNLCAKTLSISASFNQMEPTNQPVGQKKEETEWEFDQISPSKTTQLCIEDNNLNAMNAAWELVAASWLLAVALESATSAVPVSSSLLAVATLTEHPGRYVSVEKENLSLSKGLQTNRFSGWSLWRIFSSN